MVVGFALDNSTGAIDLLGKDKANHLVGKSHARERELFVGTLIDGRGETVGSSDDEDQTAGGVAFLFKPTGELHAAVLVSVLIEKYYGIRGLQLSEDELALGLFLLLLGEILGVFQFGYGGDGKRHIMTDSTGIVINACLEVLICGLADQNEFSFHMR